LRPKCARCRFRSPCIPLPTPRIPVRTLALGLWPWKSYRAICSQICVPSLQACLARETNHPSPANRYKYDRVRACPFFPYHLPVVPVHLCSLSLPLYHSRSLFSFFLSSSRPPSPFVFPLCHDHCSAPERSGSPRREAHLSPQSGMFALLVAPSDKYGLRLATSQHVRPACGRK